MGKTDGTLGLWITCALVFTVLLLNTPALVGQAVASAEISGVIVDTSGASVPNAKVTATQTSTDVVRSTVSTSDGNYALPNLPVGPYTIAVSASGFRPYVQEGEIEEE